MSHTMLYKPRDGAPNLATWNLPLDYIVVEDREITAYQAKGWKTAAEVHAPEPAPKPRAPAPKPKA